MLIEPVRLGDAGAVRAWFTGRGTAAATPVPIGQSGNLSHRRPHRPADLARERAAVGEQTGTDPAGWQSMRQVHGADVDLVDADTPAGFEHPDVDALVTQEPDRPLVVQVADCVPVLLAGPTTIAVVHAGRRGVEGRIVPAVVERIEELGDEPDGIEAVIGPAIGGCCYEVPPVMRAAVTDVIPDAAATTTWGSPSLDLRVAVARQLSEAGVAAVRDVAVCTCCDVRFFSHRRDAEAGRQIGLIVRTAGPR